ncbi:hypothetical protein SAMN02927895_00023 [Belnapia rosea]|nr:hypothetical protein SAMN02927895_00023 [Belnapia rosea]
MRSALRRQPDLDLPDMLFRSKADWPKAVATLRKVYDCEMRRACRLALAHPGWRRWVERRINADPDCQAQAERELRRNGVGALIHRENGRLRVRCGA